VWSLPRTANSKVAYANNWSILGGESDTEFIVQLSAQQSNSTINGTYREEQYESYYFQIRIG
jgi:hypothetical protein